MLSFNRKSWLKVVSTIIAPVGLQKIIVILIFFLSKLLRITADITYEMNSFYIMYTYCCYCFYTSESFPKVTLPKYSTGICIYRLRRFIYILLRNVAVLAYSKLFCKCTIVVFQYLSTVLIKVHPTFFLCWTVTDICFMLLRSSLAMQQVACSPPSNTVTFKEVGHLYASRCMQ